MDIKNENKFTNIILNYHSYKSFYKPYESDECIKFYNMFKHYYYYDQTNDILKWKGFFLTNSEHVLNI